MEYELLEDGESITKGGLGRVVDAIVGVITVKKLNNPTVYINLISTATKSGSIIYKSGYDSAQEILSVLSIIIDNNTDTGTDINTYTNSTSVADELIS